MSRLRWFGLLWITSSVIACGEDERLGNEPSSGGTAGRAGSGGTAGTGGTGGGGMAGSGGGGGSPTDRCKEPVGVNDLQGGSWDTRFSVSGFTSRYGIAPAVYDFARDADGSLLAAGRFDFFEGTTVPGLMRWKDGRWQAARSTWQLPPPADGFSAIAVSPSGALALATNDSFGERTGEVWLDDGSGLRKIGAFSGQLRSLAFFRDRLWAAGLFELSGGGAEGLAVWNGTAWSAAPGGAITGSAFELFVDGSTLFVAGAFNKVGGVNAANVAAYNGTTWTAYNFPGAFAVFALARTASGVLYAGGATTPLSQAGGIARWTGSAWSTVGGGLGNSDSRGVVTDLATRGEAVTATGCFSSAGGLAGATGARPARSMARWTGSAWQSLDDDPKGTGSAWYQPGACGDEGLTAIWDATYQRLAYDGERLVAGGLFGGVDGVLSQSIIVHDGQSWVAQGAPGLGLGGAIDRVASNGQDCDVYGAGAFSHIGGARATGRVVRFDGTRWENFTDTLPADASCAALAVGPQAQLALGCTLFPLEGDATGTVLRRSGTAMVAVPAPTLAPVSALTWSTSGKLWVSGGGSTGYVGHFDGDTLTVIEDGFDGIVNHLDVASDQDIVAAGSFTKVGDVAASRIARWNGTAWSALADGVPGQVLALEREGTTIYVSTYDEQQGEGAYLLGMFDGTRWRELATTAAGLTPNPDFSFNAIHAVTGGLLLAGTAELDDDSGRGVLVYRDGRFQALGGGVSAISADRIAVHGEAVWIAGLITAAGPDASAVSSVGVARWKLP